MIGSLSSSNSFSAVESDWNITNTKIVLGSKTKKYLPAAGYHIFTFSRLNSNLRSELQAWQLLPSGYLTSLY